MIGENPDKDKDFFLLNCRWLRYPNIHLEVEDQQYLWNRMGGQLDMRRRGGSNGQKYSINWYKFFKPYKDQEYVQGKHMELSGF